MNYHRTRTVLVVPFVIALMACLFSGWNAWDAGSVPCISVGCTVYQTFTVGGFSLWWGGVIAFAVLMVVALMGQASLGYFLSGLGLGLDCILLGIMALTAPCMACLIVALLLALCFRFFREDALTDWRNAKSSLGTSWLLAFWSVLFIVNVGFMGRGLLEPWALTEPSQESAKIHVYFSPSCTACKQLLQGISPEDAEKIAWFPVAEEGQDLAVIDAMQKQFDTSSKPLSVIFDEVKDTQPLGALELLQPRMLMLQLKLWRNQAHVLISGDGYMPFVEFRGLPTGLLKNTTRAPRGAVSQGMSSTPSSSNNAALPLDLSLGGACVGTTPAGVPCP